MSGKPSSSSSPSSPGSTGPGSADPRSGLARKLLLCSLVLGGAYLASLALWWFALAPIYPYALALPLDSLVHVAEGPVRIVQEVAPEGRAVRFHVKGYDVDKTYSLGEVLHGNLPLFLALATAGLFSVPWRQRLLFLLVGGLVLYATHLLDAWLHIRVSICDPARVGDIAEVAFTNSEAKYYDKALLLLLFGRRFIPVALWLYGAVRFGVLARLMRSGGGPACP